LSPPRAPDSRHPIHVDHTHPSVEPVPCHQACARGCGGDSRRSGPSADGHRAV